MQNLGVKSKNQHNGNSMTVELTFPWCLETAVSGLSVSEEERFHCTYLFVRSQ